jgi:hypothetical protein
MDALRRMTKDWEGYIPKRDELIYTNEVANNTTEAKTKQLFEMNVAKEISQSIRTAAAKGLNYCVSEALTQTTFRLDKPDETVPKNEEEKRNLAELKTMRSVITNEFLQDFRAAYLSQCQKNGIAIGYVDNHHIEKEEDMLKGIYQGKPVDVVLFWGVPRIPKGIYQKAQQVREDKKKAIAEMKKKEEEEEKKLKEKELEDAKKEKEIRFKEIEEKAYKEAEEKKKEEEEEEEKKD